ncbi:MAG: hypothetical protein VX589_03545 [Myxococcota bacterium]|nr:hypothetical protein [Myxococcota bacterium]
MRWLLHVGIILSIGCGAGSSAEPDEMTEFRDLSASGKPAPGENRDGRQQADPLPTDGAADTWGDATGGVSFSGASIPAAPSTNSMNETEGNVASGGAAGMEVASAAPVNDTQLDEIPPGRSESDEMPSGDSPPDGTSDDDAPRGGGSLSEPALDEIGDNEPDESTPANEGLGSEVDEAPSVDEMATQQSGGSDALAEQPEFAEGPDDAEDDVPMPNDTGSAPENMDEALGSRVQGGLDRMCVDALCHARTSNLINLEDITQLIGQQARGSAAMYVAPGSKENSYVYNVMLPVNQRTVPINGTQMPPFRRNISQIDIARFRAELGEWIDGLAQ